VLGYHAQTRRTAVHGFELAIEREGAKFHGGRLQNCQLDFYSVFNCFHIIHGNSANLIDKA
jgi:hypothetical protein